jgi:hypothetical protein
LQIHKKLRTKALVLELLAAICLVKGGHDIMTAFDNFKKEMNETKRFETLMEYFVNPENFQVDLQCRKAFEQIFTTVNRTNFLANI